MYVMSGIGDFLKMCVDGVFIRKYIFLLLIIIADVFLKMLWKEHAAEVPLL